MSESTPFAFRYGATRILLSALGMGPRFSTITVDPERLVVRMGWAFGAVIPRSSITAVTPGPKMDWWAGIGVHGWRGRWLVNGSTAGIVTIELDPPVRARSVGWPIQLRTLHVSVEEPDSLVAALS